MVSETKKFRNKKQWDCQWQEWLQLFTVLLNFHCGDNIKRYRFSFILDEALVLLSPCFTIPGRICGPHFLAMPQVLLHQTFWLFWLLLQSKSSVYKMRVSNWGKKQDTLYASLEMVQYILKWKNVIVQRTGLNNSKMSHALNGNSPHDTARKMVWQTQ